MKKINKYKEKNCMDEERDKIIINSRFPIIFNFTFEYYYI